MGDSALSVVIATRDRPEDLMRCMDALALQTVGNQLDVVVVDDGSVEDIEAVVSSHSAGVPTRYVRQAGAGVAAALDRGTALARADLLAYLDDDAVPEPGWAEAIVTAFRNWDCDAIAGRIRLRLLAPAPDWLRGKDWRALSELDLGPKPLWLRGGELPYSANCAVSRSYFERAGGFSASGVSRADGTLATAEETAFFECVRRLGGSIAYVPGACVEHVVNPRRLTTEWFMKRAVAQGASTALIRLGLDVNRPRQLMMLLREVLRLFVRLPAELARDALFRRGTVGVRLFLAYERGALFALIRRVPPTARESL